MKKNIVTTLLCLVLWGISTLACAQSYSAPALTARSWLLIDMVSGQTLGSRSETRRVEPGSLSKLMTTYLVFGALKDGRLQLNQMISASPAILKMEKGTMRMFTDEKSQVKVQELLYGLIVQGGNDAAIALSEAVSGSEERFVELMNREAERMGMLSTRFINAHGASGKKSYTTARDLSVLATSLIRDYPEYYKIYALREYTFNGIRQQNKNRLLQLDPTVDGLSGQTGEGGYSLVASAKRDSPIGERRMLAIVLGSQSAQSGSQEALKLLNWGFQNFDTVKLYERRQVIARINVWKGTQKQVPVGFNFDAYVSIPRGMASRLKSVLDRKDPLLAPIVDNSRVGTLKMMLDGKVIAELPVIALEQVNVNSGVGKLWDTLQLWFK